MDFSSGTRVLFTLAALCLPGLRAQDDPPAKPHDFKLVAAGAEAFENVGISVAVSGDVALVGASWDDDNGNDAGAAYVFERSGGTWSQVAKLLASDGTAGDVFGSAVALSGNVAVIGAYRDDENGIQSGSAYVFEQVGGAWTQVAKLLPADVGTADHFGEAVSVSGTVAVIGSAGDDDAAPDAGAAYVFEKAGGAWTQVAKLLASDGLQADTFGSGVAVCSNVIVVGARNEDDDSSPSGVDFLSNIGAAYVFEKRGGAWSETAKLMASDGEKGDRFGYAVAAAPGLIVVGAPFRQETPQEPEVGAAYVFEKIGGAWTETAALPQPDAEVWFKFGWSVAASRDTVVIGQNPHFQFEFVSLFYPSAAYAYRKLDGVWTQIAELVAGAGEVQELVAYSVAAGGDFALLGGTMGTDGGVTTGAAYVADLRSLPYGSGCPGTGGTTPLLTVTGHPEPGNTLTADISGGQPGALGLLFLGTSVADIQAGCCCTLLVGPPHVEVVFVLPGSGAVTFSGALPAAAVGTLITMQALLQDGGAPAGFSGTHAVQLTLD